jgi:hypothetical protein
MITESLAHGLAGHHLRRLRDRCDLARERAFRTVHSSDRVRTGKGARRLLAEIGTEFATTAWAGRQAQDRHGTYAAWLVPSADSDSLAICCISLRIPVGTGAEIKHKPWMIVPRHAIARGHQRLDDADWGTIQSELRVVALHSPAISVLSRALGLRQFAIPAIHGLLIGDVDEDMLVAKTFIVPPLSRRWNTVLDAWLRFEQRSCTAWTEAIELYALDQTTPTLKDALGALAEEMSSCTFLQSAHEPGPDVVGDLWEAAREQAHQRHERDEALPVSTDPA